MPLKVAGEMAQGLRMLGAFQEDPGLIPRTYMGAFNSVCDSGVRGPHAHFWCLWAPPSWCTDKRVGKTLIPIKSKSTKK